MKVGCWKSNFNSVPWKDLFNLSLNKLGRTNFHRKNSFFCQTLGCFAGSLIYPPVGTWNACCRPQGALAACLRTGGWPGSVTPTAFCSQEMESFVRIFVLHLQRPDSCSHIKSAWALPVCFSCMSFSYPCPLVRERNNTETLCWGTGRCEDPASNTQPLHAANCWDPGKHVA